MNATLHLLVTLVLCTVVVRPLARARWVWRSPRTGILLWQMLMLTWVLCAVGVAVAIGLSPYGRDIPTALSSWLGGAPRPAGFTALHVVVLVTGFAMAAGLVAALAWSWIRVVRIRRRHRDILALVAREDEELPGVLILDHPLTVAYCLPGLRAQVVVSSGALAALSPAEVAAVLAHEQTHARERHDLVLLPFAALRRLLPRIRLVGVMAEAVALLVEMRADECACRDQSPGLLATALRRVSQSAVVPPPGAIGITDGAVAARLARIDRASSPLPLLARLLLLLGGVVLVSTPLSFLVV
ncbi:M56 family metallopeptidase [Actinophytocola gossypii]|uniref:M48 family metalloprotease n=1 Tax=Actinophytocola gossypii TaxID=2812003 RepID=A0ABT2JGZ2_9PSEU|nr:M56 family metallopeptidase [Actinophytocola gossypii]MCT2587153.1 M48 family metalloprotease [Actinophytocola gossypii]